MFFEKAKTHIREKSRLPLNSVGTPTLAQNASRVHPAFPPCRIIHGHINPRVRITFPAAAEQC
jgi:hypothetical protein